MESIVLVRLPPTFCLDILSGFGVSGGEKVFSRRVSIGGDKGVLGRGFSRMISLVLRSCLFPQRGSSSGAVAGGASAVAANLSPVCIFAGLLCAPEIDPSFLIPRRTPEKKAVRSGDVSSSAESWSNDESVDSSEPCGRRVSLSDMITHSEEEQTRQKREQIWAEAQRQISRNKQGNKGPDAYRENSAHSHTISCQDFFSPEEYSVRQGLP